MRITTLLLFVFISINILPQNDNTITIANIVTLKSSYLGEDRQIFISFPPGYDQGNAKYPVLFVLDGNQHFHYASGIVNYLSANGKIPHTLVVGIPNANRNRDFTPTASETVDGSGGGNNFLDFLEKELIPYIDDNYRTSPYRILFGHSLTGMFSIYTLSTRPDLFSAFLAASPYLQYDDNYAVEVAQNEIASSYNKNKFLYMTIGNEPDYYPALDQLTGVFKSKNPDNLEWDYVKLEKDDHTTIPIKTLDAGITAVFSDWALPQNFPASGTVETLKEHFNLVAKNMDRK